MSVNYRRIKYILMPSYDGIIDGLIGALKYISMSSGARIKDEIF